MTHPHPAVADRSGEPLGATYRLLDLIGSGAVGQVWRVESVVDGSIWAAKILKAEHAADAGLVERFVRERSLLLGLRHPNIVAVRDMVVEGSVLAIVMDYVPSGTLSDLLSETGTLQPAAALTVVSQVFNALAAAHSQGIVHRDIKPDNVLLARDGQDGAGLVARVSDFGIASVIGEQDRKTTAVLGTPHYMSPELITDGAATRAGDVYATGVLLYELLAGRTPFAGQGNDFTTIYRHVTSAAPRLDLPVELWGFVESLLAKDPVDRPDAATAATRAEQLAREFGDLAALSSDAPHVGHDDTIAHPATMLRDPELRQTPQPQTEHAPAAPPVELGPADGLTIVRPLAPSTPEPEPEAEPQVPPRRLPWLTKRVVLWVCVGAVLLTTVGLAGWALVRRGERPPPASAVALEARQQDSVQPTGLSVTREASYDPGSKTTSVQFTYHAQKAPLGGSFLEVIPALPGSQACLPGGLAEHATMLLPLDFDVPSPDHLAYRLLLRSHPLQPWEDSGLGGTGRHRMQAKTILQAQRDALTHRIGEAILDAYNVESPVRGGNVVTDSAHPDVLSSLTPKFTPQLPAGGTLRQGFEALVDTALARSYPNHPRFEPGDEELRPRQLQVVYDYVERALADKERRVPLGPDAATVRRIANPLGVGKAAETHFLMGDDYFGTWGSEFARRLGPSDDDTRGPVTVGEVRGWIRGRDPAWGLARNVENLVIMTWAALRRRAWYAQGAAIKTPDLGAVRDEMELRVQPMPSPEVWTTATELAGAVFGLHASAYVTPAEVANLATDVHNKAVELSPPAHRLRSALDTARQKLRMGQAPESGRLATARTTAALCDGLRGLQGLPLIERLAAAQLGNPIAAGRSLESAGKVADLLERYAWQRFDPLLTASSQEGPRADNAAAILRRLREAVDADEFPTPLGAALKRAEDELFAWLAAATPTPAPPPDTPEPSPRPARSSGRAVIRKGQATGAVAAQLQRFVAEHPGADIVVEWRVE